MTRPRGTYRRGVVALTSLVAISIGPRTALCQTRSLPLRADPSSSWASSPTSSASAADEVDHGTAKFSYKDEDWGMTARGSRDQRRKLSWWTIALQLSKYSWKH